MDRSKVVEYIEKNIDKYMEVMGIPHWRVEVTYGPCDDPHHDASIDRNAPYNMARINIDPDRMKDEDHLARTIVHELSHIVLSPFDLYRGVMEAAYVDGSPEDRKERELWHYAVEQAVINVMRLYQGLVAHYRDRIDASSPENPN